MKPSVKGWVIAQQQDDLKVKMHPNREFDWHGRKRKLANTYREDADSEAAKKSVVAQIMFFADKELCHE